MVVDLAVLRMERLPWVRGLPSGFYSLRVLGSNQWGAPFVQKAESRWAYYYSVPSYHDKRYGDCKKFLFQLYAIFRLGCAVTNGAQESISRRHLSNNVVRRYVAPVLPWIGCASNASITLFGKLVFSSSQSRKLEWNPRGVTRSRLMRLKVMPETMSDSGCVGGRPRKTPSSFPTSLAAHASSRHRAESSRRLPPLRRRLPDTAWRKILSLTA